MKSYQVFKNFFSDSKKLRSEFESNFNDPRKTDSKRFVWDYWFFENQYHLIRTPALYYFTQKLYTSFHSHLVQWGQENLGCHNISPPWLSYYVDGCYQNLHSDVPHGPWAYVYSLTVNSSHFIGGETLILKPGVLDYWSTFQDQTDREFESFVDRIPAKFNQLTVFDPRFPHGVTEVKGTRDPLKGRLVIHGWFVEPKPYVVGTLTTSQVQKVLTPLLSDVENKIKELTPLHGTASIRLHVNKYGDVTSYKELTNTILSLTNKNSDHTEIKKYFKKLFTSATFPKSKSDSNITIPILFK